MPKSRKAPKQVRRREKEGADLVVVWGGDGMVQRCVDTARRLRRRRSAIVPAGTANLLAHNLGIPEDLAEAVRIGFHGRRRTLDLGRINGEHFAVMAGVGFDADDDRATPTAGLKKPARQARVRLGRAAARPRRAPAP